MKMLILIIAALLSAMTTTAQKLKILSFESIGGDVGEWVNDYPPYNTYNNGTFSLNLVSNSNTSDLPLNCTSGSNTSYTRRFYSQSNGSLIGDSCTVEADSVKGSWYFQYPQSNGDVIYFGVYLDDVGIERQDANGNILWIKHYGSSKGEGFGDIAVASDEGFFVLSATLGDDGDVGTHYGDAFSTDIWVLRLDNDGEMLWGRVLGGSSWDVARTILAADDGGCYIFGGTASNDHDAVGQKGEGDLFVAKLDSLGNIVWANCYGGSKGEYDFNNSFFAEPDGWGGFYILCRTDSNDGDVQNKTDNSPDFWLVHIDKDGNILWEKNYGLTLFFWGLSKKFF